MMPHNHALLLIAFGTSHNNATGPYQAMEEEILRDYPAKSIRWSYTSQTIRAALARQGIIIPTIEENLASWVSEGVRNLQVQSLHIVRGKEFSEMEKELLQALTKFPESFDHVSLGNPLLETKRDREEVVAAVLSHFPKERTKDEAILFMAHGQKDGHGDPTLAALEEEILRQDPLAFTATLDGKKSFEDALLQIKEAGVKTVWLAPFLFLAGKHVKIDLAGKSPDSWENKLKREGFAVKTDLRGLGENPEIRFIFAQHALESMEIPLVLWRP